MALGRSAAVVIGSFPLGESDLLVTFFSRQQGKIRGVARAARRMRSRLSGALEVFTLGELIFFERGQSGLVQIDHFDIVRPFARLREDLERIGQAAWMVECVGRLTAERDPHPAVYGLLVRALTAVEAGGAPARAASAFGVRCIDALGHRLRLDVCVGCGVRAGLTGVAIDVASGGVVCRRCVAATPGALDMSPSGLRALRWLRTCSWPEAMTVTLPPVENELRQLLDAHVAHLSGHTARASRFLREIDKLAGRSR